LKLQQIKPLMKFVH